MVKILIVCFALAALTACQADTRNYMVEDMLPDDAVYDQIPPAPSLKKKFVTGGFTYEGKQSFEVEQQSYTNWTRNFDSALARALDKAGYLSSTKAPYKISGTIVDFKLPNCLYASCDGGSAIQYIVTRTKDQSVVFSETIVVPYTKETPFSFEVQPEVMFSHGARVLAENIAHFIHLISTQPQTFK